jgi:hypothetical protein
MKWAHGTVRNAERGGSRLTPRIPGPGPTGPRPLRTRTTDPIPDSPMVSRFRGKIAPDSPRVMPKPA